MHNPPEKDLDKTLAEELEVSGRDASDPKYIRETYGKWTEDFDSLVFKFNPSINVYKEEPKDLTYVFGIDLGFNDADAIAVLGYNLQSGKVYLVEEVVASKQGITELVAQIETLRAKYKPVKMVLDAGGLGKKIQEEILKRHQLPVEAAEKSRKFEFIELMNDDLRTGRFLAKPKSIFEQDCYLVQWDRNVRDPAKLQISKSFHSDICDATLYGWKLCYHFIKNQEAKKPINKHTDAYMDLLEEREAALLDAKKDFDNNVDHDDLVYIFSEG
jgi:CxxC motif-containing protein